MASNLPRGKAPVEPLSETAPRPPIWVEGRQRPKFHLPSFALVAEDMARRDLAPALSGMADRLADLGARVMAGEWRVTAAWARRVLPDHQRVGAAILGARRLILGAATLTLPEEVPLAYPDLARATPSQPPQSGVEPTLQAIRSAIATSPHHLPADTANPPPQGGKRAWGDLVASWLLLRVAMLVALPLGAAKALMFHLEGGDLRDWS